MGGVGGLGEFVRVGGGGGYVVGYVVGGGRRWSGGNIWQRWSSTGPDPSRY